MSNSIEEARQRVEEYLTSVGTVEIDSDGDFTFQQSSTRVFVSVVPHPNGQATIVRIMAPMVLGAELTPELFEYVAFNTDNWVFGTIALERDDQGTVAILFRTSLLGDFLDHDELIYSLASVAQTADELDDELAARFGGSVLNS